MCSNFGSAAVSVHAVKTNRKRRSEINLNANETGLLKWPNYAPSKKKKDVFIGYGFSKYSEDERKLKQETGFLSFEDTKTKQNKLGAFLGFTERTEKTAAVFGSEALAS